MLYREFVLFYDTISDFLQNCNIHLFMYKIKLILMDMYEITVLYLCSWRNCPLLSFTGHLTGGGVASLPSGLRELSLVIRDDRHAADLCDAFTNLGRRFPSLKKLRKSHLLLLYAFLWQHSVSKLLFKNVHCNAYLLVEKLCLIICYWTTTYITSR